MAGIVNHFSQIRVLTSGEAAEMAARPRIRPQMPPFAQPTALTCKAPSAFRISQAAPMKLYPTVRNTAVSTPKPMAAQLWLRPST